MYWDFRFVTIVSLQCFDLYPINISTKSTKTEGCTDVMKAESFICYCSISKLTTKVQIERHKYLRYTLFCSPWWYFRCREGARHECVPNFPALQKGVWDFLVFWFFGLDLVLFAKVKKDLVSTFYTVTETRFFTFLLIIQNINFYTLTETRVLTFLLITWDLSKIKKSEHQFIFVDIFK